MNTTTLAANVPYYIPEGELETRVAVAACYRLLVHYRLSDLMNGFVAARIPDEPDACLVGRWAEFPEEVTASSLVRMSIHNTNNVVVGKDVAHAAVPLFQALFQSRPDVNCVIHTHTKATETLPSLGCELLPMSHAAFIVHKQTGYVDFAFYHDEEFCAVMVEAFKGNVCLLMRNHGMMAVGDTPAAAFLYTYMLDQACAIQLAAYQSGRDICLPKDVDKISEMYASEEADETGFSLAKRQPVSHGFRQWGGWLRMLDRKDASYKM
jgi:ribulose-5-phosphate 4-epimerase/fuculose-1-phosphate aldolase